MAPSSPGPFARPMSPHIMQWRWHLTMFCSIATRATGVALYAGFLLLALWALSLAAGPEAYGVFADVMGSVLGRLVMFGFTVSVLYHLAAGVRHLVWDSGHGFQPRTATATGALALAFGVVGALVVFAVGYLVGAL